MKYRVTKLAVKTEIVNGRQLFYCEVNGKPSATRYYFTTPEKALKGYEEMPEEKAPCVTE